MTGLIHDAFVYSDDAEYVASMAPFAREGIAAGEAVVAVTRPGNVALLRDALGTVAGGLRTIDAREWYERPAGTVASYSRLFGRLLDAGAPAVRLIGEVQFGATAERHDEWICYESVLNRAFADLPAWVVCPYDTRSLPDDVVESAASTHPFVTDASGRSASTRYCSPERFVAARRPADGLPARAPDVDLALTHGITRIRRELSTVARARTHDERLTEEFVLAANEVATNAVVHGGGRGRVRLWADDHALACVVTDGGPGLDDALVGVEPPGSDGVGGRGLWIARQLCDDVRIGRAPEGGLAVTLRAASR